MSYRLSLLTSRTSRLLTTTRISPHAHTRSVSNFFGKFSQKEEGTPDKEKKEEPAKPAEATGPYSLLVKFAGIVKSELFESSVHAKKADPYIAPQKLAREEKKSSPIEVNTDETGVVLHQSSKWASTWRSFRDNNPVVNKYFEWKMKFDESDNLLVRATRSVTDTVVTNVGGVFEEGEMAQTLAEIAKIDPNFDKDEFTLYVEKSIIPPVLEAFYAGDLKALKGWSSEASYGVFEAQVQQQQQAGLRVEFKILDVRNVDLALAKVMDDAPVMMFSFSVHQIICVRDKSGKIKEGSEDDVQNALYVIALRRDPSNFDPKLAWEVMELGMQFSASSW